ncbi:Ig-like domain-containing protein [Psychrobacter fjordensis]|uniref:Ig-like domain-containing protein n=1 Tax=Psychrobacter fjordensis TaxID=664424 RepID=UPI00191AE557|nr:Ig-like domain-containing protein [Psychrobacter fjordensis]
MTEFSVDGNATAYQPGDTATISGIGTITITPEGILTFTPNDGYEGAVPDVTYTVTDGNGGSDDAVVSFADVPAAPNTPPIAGDDTVTPEYNTPAEKNLFENDSDLDGDTLSVTEFSVDGNATAYQPGDTATISGIGTITITPEGILTFTPNDGYEGAVPDVTYTVTDGNGGSDDAVVSFADVPAAPNTPPIAGDDTVTPEYNTPAEKDLFENDSDLDGDTLTIDGFSVDGNSYQPGDTATISGIGTITITPEGILTFTPNDGYEGAVPDVTYTVTDGNGGSDDAVVSFADVPAAPNTPPIAGDDTVTPEYNTPAEKNLFENDSDLDGDTLSVTEFSVDGNATAYQPGDTATISGIGTITITPEGILTFTPNDGYEGAVPDVTYTVTDGNGGSDDAVVSFADVPAAPNTPPIAGDDTVTPEYNTPAEKDLFENDSDADGDTLTIDGFTVDGNSYQPGDTATISGIGTITITPEGILTFTPNDGYEGAVPDVTYTVTDGNGGSDDAVVSFADVPAAPNTPPIAGDDTVTPEYNTPAEKDLFENDSDLDGDTLSVTEFSVDGNATAYQPGDTATISGIGTITITPEGILTFTPNDGYEGAVPDVTYTVTDGNGGSDDAVVSFADVPAAPNTPPIAGDDTVTPEYNTPAEKTCLKTTAI